MCDKFCHVSHDGLTCKKEGKDVTTLLKQHPMQRCSKALLAVIAFIQSFLSVSPLLRLFILIPGDFLIFVGGTSKPDVHISGNRAGPTATGDVNACDVCIKGMDGRTTEMEDTAGSCVLTRGSKS